MKNCFLFLYGLLFLSGCSKDNSGFIDQYSDYEPDDGVSCYAYYRIANATGYPLSVGVCELGTDVELDAVCEPGHAFVYAVVSRSEVAFDKAFAHIALTFLYPTRAESTYSYPNFGVSSETPDLCDKSQWQTERVGDRIVWRTYIVTDADYQAVCGGQ